MVFNDTLEISGSDITKDLPVHLRPNGTQWGQLRVVLQFPQPVFQVVTGGLYL